MVLVAVTILPAFTNVQSASSNVALQTLAPPAMRGRVVGLYSMTFSALLPVGTITAGWLGTRFGVRETLIVLAGAMALLVLLIYRRRPTLVRDLAVAAPPPVARRRPGRAAGPDLARAGHRGTAGRLTRVRCPLAAGN